ncbi:MAG: hypothetical protein ACLR2O_10655 [Coprococcus sp.]
MIEELEAEVRLHDPYEALDGKEGRSLFLPDPGRKGSGISDTNGGWLVMEIGYDQEVQMWKNC